MTPDARLSAAERAALAHLEAAASAEDPQFAARLRGSTSARFRAVRPIVLAVFIAAWRWLLQLGWWSLVLVASGLGLMMWGLGSGLAISLVGVAACTVGLRALAAIAEAGSEGRRSGQL
jgi:hypothetical protein